MFATVWSASISMFLALVLWVSTSYAKNVEHPQLRVQRPPTQECKIVGQTIAFALSKHYSYHSLKSDYMLKVFERYLSAVLEDAEEFFIETDRTYFGDLKKKVTVADLRDVLTGTDCSLFEGMALRRLHALQRASQVLGHAPDSFVDRVRQFRNRFSKVKFKEGDLPAADGDLEDYTAGRLLKETQEKLIEYGDLAEFQEVLDYIVRRHYHFIAQRRRDAVRFFLNKTLEIAMVSLDPHSGFSTPDELFAEGEQDGSAASAVGLGVEVNANTPFGIRVESTLPEIVNLAGARIQPGDYIAAVDGVSVVGMPLWIFKKHTLGEVGSSARVSMIRIDTNTRQRFEFEASIARRKSAAVADAIQVRGENVHGRQIVYISFQSFEEGVSAEVRKRLQTELLQSPKVDAVVLDLRENPGGRVSEAMGILGLFIENAVPQVEVEGAHSGKTIQWTTPKEPRLWTGPLVVAINRNSASSAELVAGALQDFQRAILVGALNHTYGKGTIQTKYTGGNDVPYGRIKVTRSRFFLPSGRSTQWDGLYGDIRIHAEESSSSKMESEYVDAYRSMRLKSAIPQSPFLEAQDRCVTTKKELRTTLQNAVTERAKKDNLSFDEQTLELGQIAADFVAICEKP